MTSTSKKKNEQSQKTKEFSKMLEKLLLTEISYKIRDKLKFITLTSIKQLLFARNTIYVAIMFHCMVKIMTRSFEKYSGEKIVLQIKATFAKQRHFFTNK